MLLYMLLLSPIAFYTNYCITTILLISPTGPPGPRAPEELYSKLNDIISPYSTHTINWLIIILMYRYIIKSIIVSYILV